MQDRGMGEARQDQMVDAVIRLRPLQEIDERATNRARRSALPEQTRLGAGDDEAVEPACPHSSSRPA